MNLSKTLKTLTIMCAMAALTTAKAEDFCATNSSELITALETASNNNEADLIMIQRGTYMAPVPHGFEYTTTQDDDIEISGGWVDLLGSPCNFLVTSSPGETYLDGNLETRLMRIRLNAGDTKIKISGLSFINGDGDVGKSGTALEFTTTELNSNAEITLENNAFFNNNNAFYAALDLRTTAAKIVIRNNLFAYNNTASTGATVSIRTSESSQKLYLTNNTVLGNTGGGLFINLENDSSQALIANNIFWNNGHMDLNLRGDGYKFLRHNSIGIQTGVAADETLNNISEPPYFDAGPMNFSPSAYSSMVGGGIRPPSFAPIPIPFELDWSTGSTDVEGNQRWQGFEIDIGAIESPHITPIAEPPIFKDGFDLIEE